jgi:hypothetical protein
VLVQFVAALAAALSAGAVPELVGFPIELRCSESYQQEVALGSKARKPFAEYLADGGGSFDGTHNQRPALRGYICKKDLVTSQIISLEFTSKAVAFQNFDSNLKSLSERFGQPCQWWHRLSSKQRRKAERLYRYSKLDRYMSEWVQRTGATTSLSISEWKKDVAPWRVTIVTNYKSPVCH